MFDKKGYIVVDKTKTDEDALMSAAPFLCLMVCHLEWPDISDPPIC
jgi:hypothetical protein